jgi:hypothetical protein
MQDALRVALNVSGQRCQRAAIVATSRKVSQDTKEKLPHFNPSKPCATQLGIL